MDLTGGTRQGASFLAILKALGNPSAGRSQADEAEHGEDDRRWLRHRCHAKAYIITPASR